MIPTKSIELLTYVALDKTRDYQTESINAFKSGAHYYFCNQALIKKPVTELDVQGMKNYFGALPYSVWASAKNKKIGQSLVTHGFKSKESFSLMFANLESIAPCVFKEGVVVKELIDIKEALEVWVPLVAQAFDASAEEFEKFVLYLQTTPIAKNIKYFVACLNGIPSSTNMLIEYQDFIAMDWVGTIPSQRNKGLGFAISCVPLHTINKFGAKDVLLMASKFAESMYTKIGFKEVGRYDVYAVGTRH